MKNDVYPVSVKGLWNIFCGGIRDNKDTMVYPFLVLDIPQPFNANRFLIALHFRKFCAFSCYTTHLTDVIGNDLYFIEDTWKQIMGPISYFSELIIQSLNTNMCYCCMETKDKLEIVDQ